MQKLIISLFLLGTLNLTGPVNVGNLKNMRQKAQDNQYDGPYVRYRDDKIFIDYIMESNGIKTLQRDTIAWQQRSNISLKVMTDVIRKTLQVRLKNVLQNEKSEYPGAKKLLVLSDIEGNFGAMRKLLQGNKVIDKNFNWTFGTGNLVLIGDFFDRGDEVTEVLWLIYYLEEKAKTCGGYVHFILGNHEIMNLSGDLRYVPKKYLDNASLLNQKYITLYNETSELGRWLRTKNIIEKIGDIVVVHAGISREVNRMEISIPGINALTRPYYADDVYNYADERLDVMLGDLGPFWYRGYYEKSNPGILSQINTTLSQFGVKHIITGHTIVSNTISVWYNGKLVNTDVPHAGGRSEALLIEDDKYYRVNADGEKVLLLPPN